MVGGHNPEPLLGDKDAAALGIITFNPVGRDPTPEEEEEERHNTNQVRKLKESSMPGKLRSSGFQRETRKGPVECIKQSDKTAAMAIVKRFPNTAFLPGIGCITPEPVKFAFNKDFKPIQPPRRGVPYHYQDRLTDHLELMQKEGAIETVDPREEIDCTMNVVITEKKT